MRYLSLLFFLAASFACSAQVAHQSEADSLGYGARIYHPERFIDPRLNCFCPPPGFFKPDTASMNQYPYQFAEDNPVIIADSTKKNLKPLLLP